MLNFRTDFLTYTLNGIVSNCTVISHSDPINISNSTFDNSTFSAVNNSSSLIPYTTNLIHNTFTADHSAQTAIYLYNYTEFNINDNTIHGYYNGISLNSSGSSTNINRQLNNNTIDASGMYAINIYNSAAVLAQNHIYENNRGIGLLNRSNVNIYGNPLAHDYSEVNIIKNNTSYEVFATAESFPWYFRYNAIFDPDNSGGQTDALIYYETPGGGHENPDVNFNCWDDYFYPNSDLYPFAAFIYDSDYDWCPSGGGHKSTEIALDDFQQGLDFFENGQYADAKTSFEAVIEQYPKTQYAGAAMHELFSLEKYMDNEYGILQQYYESNDSIQADTILTKLAVFLSNKCEIELQNWQTAIDHFENVIENPETPEDSIFAIIDLGYTYLLMGDSGYKSTAQGGLVEYIPTSVESFSKNRDYLISLLPFGKSEQAETTLFDSEKTGQLLQNVPNPFTNTTTIQFNLNSKEFSSVEIRIHDQVGKEVQHIPVQSAKEGANTVDLNMQGLPSGIYYYSLIVNGTQADTKKMVVVK